MMALTGAALTGKVAVVTGAAASGTPPDPGTLNCFS